MSFSHSLSHIPLGTLSQRKKDLIAIETETMKKWSTFFLSFSVSAFGFVESSFASQTDFTGSEICCFND